LQWSELAAPWQTCWQEAWEACRVGCVPVGAVILDENGREISRGRNRIGADAPPGQIGHSDLAHAEMNALIQVARTRINTHTCILYTLLEPCPLCMGAIYMVGVRTVAYAARDAFAGSINLLGATPYYSRKKNPRDYTVFTRGGSGCGCAKHRPASCSRVQPREVCRPVYRLGGFLTQRLPGGCCPV